MSIFSSLVPRPLPSSLVVFVLTACGSGEPEHARAELIFRGGPIYTADSAHPSAQMVAVRGGRIVFVGDSAAAGDWTGPETRLVDLHGKLLLPAFHDGHVHPVTGGVQLGDCLLSGLSTRQAVLDRIAGCARDDTRSWVRGRGWELPLFPGGNPPKATLDSLIPDRPAVMTGADGHSSWANSRALRAAGITRETKDPARGRIERDPRTGEPSGTLREDAMDLVDDYEPPRSAAEYERGLERALALANRLGIVALTEADADTLVMNAYTALDRRGALTARVIASLRVDPAAGTAQVPRLAALRERYAGQRLRATATKIFADGVLEAKTGYVLQPYLGGGGHGLPELTAAAFDSIVVALDKAGFQVHVHAIGDAAVREALDAFAAARQANGMRDARHQIAHLEMIDPADVPRFRALAVTANVQPLWAYRDTYIQQLTEPILGPVRSARLYPIGELVRSGAPLAAGSDWNVSSMNPLEAMQVAVTRRAPDDSVAGPPWLPDQVVTLPQIIAAYTIGAAYANFEEKESGTITTGKSADLIVLDRDLFHIAPPQIHQARVLLTLLAGRPVYRDSTFFR